MSYIEKKHRRQQNKLLSNRGKMEKVGLLSAFPASSSFWVFEAAVLERALQTRLAQRSACLCLMRAEIKAVSLPPAPPHPHLSSKF